MKTILLIAFMFAVTSAINAQSNPDKNPGAGVPRELARWRAEHYSNVQYLIDVKLSRGAPMLKGEMEIRVTLAGRARRIVLDWRIQPQKPGQARPDVSHIFLNGKPATRARFVDEHIVIEGARRGENVVRLRFESPIATSGSAVTRYLDREDKSEYIYTLFVPSDASTAFPCFDQPDLKAQFRFSATIPEEWEIVSNSQIQFIDRWQKARRTDAIPPGNIKISFQLTKPISTYLFAFAAGPFVEFKEADYSQDKNIGPASTPMRVFVRKSKVERTKRELPEVFRLNRQGLRFLATYFDYEFPFPKYDLVIIPEFAYRGMEHAGATFLREESILFPSEPTANDFLSRANVILHEAAHQWFGDLVTMRWFDDLWLKEGFAEFMSFKAIEATMPEMNAWKAFYERTKPTAYLTDATKGTTPIYQEIPNLSAAKSAYGNIVYRKAPSMLRQAEFYLGPEKFQRAIRLFLKEHAYANAEWADLVRDFETTSGQNLDQWAAAWVKRRGMAEVRVTWNKNSDGTVRSITLAQRNVLDEGGAWPMRLNVLFLFSDGTTRTSTVTLLGDGTSTDIEVDGVENERRLLCVFANNDDYGYGQFPLDEESRKYVLDHLGEQSNDFLRALLWGSLWDSVRGAELAPAVYIDLAIRNAGKERDEVTLQGILGRVNVAFNVYLSDSQRRDVAPQLERMLFDKAMNADTVGQRITYFRAFQSAATTESARSDLKKVLKGELKIPGMSLRPRDRFDIITSLLAHGDADGPALLAAQSATDTSDDGRRYAYAAGAALGVEENKQKYFDAFLNDQNLAESWIEAAVGPFNTIHQSELTLPYLERALLELPKLKRTRKIFFVNGWLAAFIGGQRDDRALAIVTKFLESTSANGGSTGAALDRDLRLKVLEAVDGLERAVRIRAKYAVGN